MKIISLLGLASVSTPIGGVATYYLLLPKDNKEKIKKLKTTNEEYQEQNKELEKTVKELKDATAQAKETRAQKVSSYQATIESHKRKHSCMRDLMAKYNTYLSRPNFESCAK